MTKTRRKSRFKVARPPEEDDVPNEAVTYDKADAYRIMRAKFLHAGMANHHLESFADFVGVKIPQCLSEHPPVEVIHEAAKTKHVVEIRGVRYDRPSVKEANGVNRYVTPHECHVRRLTYKMNMLVDARYIIREYDPEIADQETRNQGKILHSVYFRDKVFDFIPVMKMSKYCVWDEDPESMIEDAGDCGGYFISTGAEKVVVGQENPRNNYPFVMCDSDGNYRCEFRSFNEAKFRSTSTLYTYLVPPYVTDQVEERRTCVPRVTVKIPFVDDPLPLPVAFKLLGVQDTEAMLDYFCTEADDPPWFRQRAMDVLLYNMDAVVMTHEHAVTRLGHDRGQTYGTRKRKAGEEETAAQKRRRRRLETETEYERCQKQVASIINSEFLPHQGFGYDTVESKLVLFGICVRKLLRVYYGLSEKDNRDHYMHRRVMLSSPLMTLLFRKHFTLWRRRLASQIRRELNNGSQFVNIKDLLHTNIGSNLHSALSTGNFSMQRGQNNLDGVSQVLNRTEPHAAVSHVNRTSNPMNKEGRSTGPRLQDDSYMGIIDPWETPEGQACGLMRNMAPMAGVRVGYSTETLTAAVLSTGMVDPAGRNVALARHTNCPVLVSGTLVGTCSVPDPKTLVDLLRARRAVQDLPFDVSIFRTTGRWAITPHGEICINGDAGSYWWPLIRVDRRHELRDVLDHVTNEDDLWSALMSEGIIEAINKDEEANCVRVALRTADLLKKPEGTYTHVVIHPSQICSVFTARGPLLEFCQAPRITYQAGMGKQAIGRRLTNHRHRVDTASHTLWYPERPLVGTFMDDVLSHDTGVISVQNPVVCILASGGYNIEDSIIFNEASIQLGLFRSSVTRTYRDMVRRGDCENEELALPNDECRSRLHASYDQVDPDTGVVAPGTHVEGNDVLISKVVHMTRKMKVPDEEHPGQEKEVEIDKVRDRSTTVKTREPAVVDDVIMSTSLDGETTVRVKTRSQRIPEVGDKFCCLTGDHQVLTRDHGWVPIADVKTTEHRVACLDRATHTVHYQAPEAVWAYGVDPDRADNGKLVELTSVNVSLRVTQNHRLALLTDTGDVELVCAEHAVTERADLAHYVHAVGGVGTPALPLPGAVQAILDRAMPREREALLFLCGFCAMYASTVPGRAARFAIPSLLREESQKAVREAVLDDLGLTMWNEPMVVNQTWFESADLYLMLKEGATGGRVPAWVHTGLGQADSWQVLRGYLGHPRDVHVALTSLSVAEYVDEFQTLSVHAGVSVQKQYTNGNVYTFHMARGTQQTSRTRARDVGVWSRTEPVYCLSVPPGEVFCVRRDNCIAWTGNSRYGQKGTIGAIYPKVDMPFNKDGMTPDIIINPHCFVAGTPVTLPAGYSVPIETFRDRPDVNVLSWNDQGLEVTPETRFYAPGVQTVGTLTLEDGRTIRCTPDHKFMTESGWVEAQDLVDLQVTMGLEAPLDQVGDDERNWLLSTPMATISCEEDRPKALAFARLLGLLYTDGCLTTVTNSRFQGYLYIGTMLDANAALDDIECLTKKRPTVTLYTRDDRPDEMFVIALPAELSRSYASLQGMPIGNRAKSPTSIPVFLATAPVAIKREFLGGVFGGDGWAPSLVNMKETAKTVARKTLTPVTYARSTARRFVDSLKTTQETIIQLLEDCGVPNARLDGPIARASEKTAHFTGDDERLGYRIVVPTNPAFGDNVGFRYCNQKWLRLCAAQTYWRYIDEVAKQHFRVIDGLSQLFEDGHGSLDQCRIKAIADEATARPLLNDYYSAPSMTIINNRRRSARGRSLQRLDFRFIDTPEEFLTRNGTLGWFDKRTYIVKQHDAHLPTFTMKAIDYRISATEPVFCIGVPPNASFCAYGAIASNCIPSRMTIGHLIEKLMGKVAALSGELADGTPFEVSEATLDSDDHDAVIKEVGRMLTHYGYREDGTEELRDGRTGKLMKMHVFMGPMSYQKLRHMVRDKYHARSRGPVQMQTHQPVEGRHREGGQRFGEMERDCVLAQGAAALTQERLLISSDKASVPVCTKCGRVAQPPKRNAGNQLFAAAVHADRPFCHSCLSHDTVRNCEMPYAYKLSTQEVEGLHLKAGFDFDQDPAALL